MIPEVIVLEADPEARDGEVIAEPAAIVGGVSEIRVDAAFKELAESEAEAAESEGSVIEGASMGTAEDAAPVERGVAVEDAAVANAIGEDP